MSKPIIRRFLSIFSSNLIGIFLMFLATPIIVRILGAERYGDYAFVLSILSILLLFVDAGIYDGIRKYLKESDRPADWPDRVFALYSRVGFALVSVMSIALLVVVEIGVVRRHFGPRFDLYFILIAITLASKQTFTIARGTLMGFDREDVSEKLYILNRLLFVICGILLLLLGFGVPGLIGAKILANFATASIGYAVIVRYIDYSYIFSKIPDGFPQRQLLTFNFLSIVLFALHVSIKHVDVVLIQFFYGSTSTGYYKAALNLAEFVWFVPRIVQITLLHSTSELWSEGKTEEITSISSRVTRYSLLFTALLVLGLATLAELTVTIYYGADFQPAVLPLLILLPGTIGFAVARPILAIGQGKGDFRYLIYATGAASALNLVLNLLLIPQFGIVGAAVATSVGYLSMLVFHVSSAWSIGFNPVADLRVPRVGMTILIAGTLIFLLGSIIESTVLSFLLVPPVGLLIYLITAVIVGAVSRNELYELRRQLGI